MSRKVRETTGPERRYDFTVASECRVGGDDAAPTIEGYSARFNALSEDLGGFREQIAPGAFADTIQTHDIRALFNHDPNFVLGRNRAGTLRLEEDAVGLRMVNDPPDTEWARGLVTTVKRRDVTGQSFSFRKLDDEWQVVKGENLRTLKAVRLYDVGPVTFPAYPATDVHARSILDSVGVEVPSLLAALVRAERGLEMTAEDRERLHDAGQRIVSLASAPARDAVAGMRRRLELAAVA